MSVWFLVPFKNATTVRNDLHQSQRQCHKLVTPPPDVPHHRLNRYIKFFIKMILKTLGVKILLNDNKKGENSTKQSEID